jgi:DNA helicase-2/ATP-dependent DNA helicase PcrA
MAAVDTRFLDSLLCHFTFSILHSTFPLVPSFSSELQRLNPDQRLAVDTVEGPVMVVAGPGTGKTQVLAMRVANILRKTHAKPGNILCLTFSTSGAQQMRERLRELIGADAYGVTVSTIHGFCNDIIQSHPLVFDSWSMLEQISDVERYRTVKKVIDSLLPDLVLVNKKHPYLRIKDILGRMSTLKREGVTDGDRLKEVAEAYEEVLSGKSKEGTKANEQNLLRARKFKEFVEVFLRYQDELKSTGRYDYDDMILTVIDALKEHDWLLASLQERFQYLLVDEFQDTNGAQYALMDLLTLARTPEDKPNFFVVGDDDQAIYRFQGANLQNILKFHTRFPTAAVVVLKTSYRCTQPILDAAGSLITKNTERLVGRIEGLTKDLIAGRKGKAASPGLIFSPSDTTEPWLIADLIEDRLKQKTLPNEIAILTQTNAELRPIYDVLRARNLPVQLTGKLDLLTHPLVSQAIIILRAICHPKDNGLLAAALGCECFGCHPADLGRIFGSRPRDGSLLDHVLGFNLPGAEDPVALHERETFLHARDVLLELNQKRLSRSIVETLEHVIKDSGILLPDTYHLTPSQSEEKQPAIDPLDFAAVQEFFDRIKYRAYEQPSFTADTFDDDLSYYLEPEYGDLRLTYELPHLTDAGVQLMTAHKSKGLEFDVVIIPNFREKQWDHRRNPSVLSMPEDLLFGWEKEKKDYEKEQDERRVAYVAMTRARHELIFTCPRQLTMGEQNKAVSPSAFFAEAGTLPETEKELKNPEEAATLRFTPVRDIDEEFKTFLRHRLKDYSLSVTALNHFLDGPDGPQKFLHLDLLQTPQSKESSLVYGNAVHDALRKWSLALQKGQRMEQAGFMTAFETYLNEREVLTEPEKKRLIKLGQESLPRYFAARLQDATPMISHVEHPISTRLKDIPIKGKLDRIDLVAQDSGRIMIIDYKTGRPRTDAEIRKEGYFRQLVFYALLLENGMPFFEPVSYTLDFVGEGSEHPVERTFQITEADKDELRKTIEAVWAKVMALDFTPL